MWKGERPKIQKTLLGFKAYSNASPVPDVVLTKGR